MFFFGDSFDINFDCKKNILTRGIFFNETVKFRSGLN